MLIFSTIAAIISPIIYLFPFLYLWLKQGKSVYKIRDKVINNKNVFMVKIALIIILVILFSLTFPTKVMFYPGKVGIFVGILAIVQLLTNFIIIDGKHELQPKEFVCWMVLLGLSLISAAGVFEQNEKISEAPESSTVIYEIEHISNGNVFFHDQTDESLEVISISDDSLEIVLQEDSQLPYLEKITTWQTYSKRYEKEKNIYDDMSTSSERYVVYASKSDLYK